jgi:hypothetical protein
MESKRREHIKPNPKLHLTPDSIEILKGLGEHKFLTTRQVWQEILPNKSLRQVQRDLKHLVEVGLVSFFPVNPAQGTSSAYYWQLKARGVGVVQAKTRTKNLRRPTPEQLHFKGLKLELIREVSYAGWDLVEPVHYNSAFPRPKQTPQYGVLRRAIDILEKEKLEKMRLKGQGDTLYRQKIEQGMHLWGVPSQANDYVVYQSGSSLAVILILCPPNAGVKFWQRRVSLYLPILKNIPVYVVFEKREEWQGKIARFGFKPVSVDEVYKLLREIEEI